MIFFACPARSTRALGPPRQLRIPPVDSFEHVGHLRRRDRHDALLRRRPDELSPVEPLGVERQPKAVVPEDLRQVASAPAENVEIAAVRIALQLLLNLKRKPPACRDACQCGPPRSTPAPSSASGSSFAQNVQNPSKRIGVDLVVDAHAAPGAKLDLDDAGLRSPSARHRARMSCRL
jgi:hypothetical protein